MSDSKTKKYDILDEIKDAIAISDGIESRIKEECRKRLDSIEEPTLACYHAEVARLQRELVDAQDDLNLAIEDLKKAKLNAIKVYKQNHPTPKLD